MPPMASTLVVEVISSRREDGIPARTDPIRHQQGENAACCTDTSSLGSKGEDDEGADGTRKGGTRVLRPPQGGTEEILCSDEESAFLAVAEVCMPAVGRSAAGVDTEARGMGAAIRSSKRSSWRGIALRPLNMGHPMAREDEREGGGGYAFGVERPASECIGCVEALREVESHDCASEAVEGNRCSGI